MYKETKELHVKYRKIVDLENFKLGPLQKALLNYFEPNRREIIWLIGRK